MRRLLLSVALLAVISPFASAQRVEAPSTLDTITITSKAPLRVRLHNTGARIAVIGISSVTADTMEVATPVRVTLPRENFTLDIVAIPATQEARIVFPSDGHALPKPRLNETTLFTPIRIERDSGGASLVLKYAKMESRRTP